MINYQVPELAEHIIQIVQNEKIVGFAQTISWDKPIVLLGRSTLNVGLSYVEVHEDFDIDTPTDVRLYTQPLKEVMRTYDVAEGPIKALESDGDPVLVREFKNAILLNNYKEFSCDGVRIYETMTFVEEKFNEKWDKIGRVDLGFGRTD